MNSGRHVPEGTLSVRDDAHRTIEEPLPLAAIAPMILRYFGVDAPATMRGDLTLASEVA